MTNGLTWRALNSLSKTVRDRGGISEARLAGVNSLMGLKKLEHDIKRSERADERADTLLGLQEAEAGRKKEAWEMGASGRELAKQQADEQLAPTTLNVKQFLPGNTATGLTAAFTPDKNGVSNYDLLNNILPGSAWDEKGNRINKKGEVVTVPKWKAERYGSAAMLTYAARTDPIKLAGDRLFEYQTALQEDPDNVEIQDKINKIDAFMKDPTQIAMAYGQQVAKVSEGLAQAIASGMKPGIIQALQSEVARAEAKFKTYLSKIPDKKYNLEIKKLEQAIATSKAQMKKAEAEAEKARRSKPLTQYQDATIRGRALNIVNKEIENMSFDTQWQGMTPEQREAWKEQRYQQVYNTMLPGGDLPGIGSKKTGSPTNEANNLWNQMVQRGDSPQQVLQGLKNKGYDDVAKEFEALMNKSALPNLMQPSH